MKIYMDACCLKRLFDDQMQDKIRIGSDAILAILSKCMQGQGHLLSSEVIISKLGKPLMNGKKLGSKNFTRWLKEK